MKTAITVLALLFTSGEFEPVTSFDDPIRLQAFVSEVSPVPLPASWILLASAIPLAGAFRGGWWRSRQGDGQA
jgi:hypothetical protein